MKLHYAIISAIFALCLGCKSKPAEENIIDENIAVAEQQIGTLCQQSLATGEPRIPSTFKNDKVVYVPIDDWVSGFFAGTLWYMYELTGDEKWAVDARSHTMILDSVKYLTWHHDVGFMINCSYGNALRLAPAEGDSEVMVTAARSLATRFNPATGLIQSWNVNRGWQAERGWLYPVIIDNMMNLELLFKAAEMSGDTTLRDIAVKHADRTMAEHFRPDGSCYHVVDYDPETGEVRRRCTAQGYADESAWARGQAWALYGYTLCYRYTRDERYLRHAEKVCNYLFNDPGMPEDLVPYWDFDAPDIPDACRDASSAAVIASGLYELYTYTDNEKYKEYADKMVASLSTPAYRAEVGQNGGFILMHSVGSIPHNSSIDVPLNYADYYFLEALLRKRDIENGKPLF